MTRTGLLHRLSAPTDRVASGAPGPVDASMGLLRDVMDHPLDAGYEMAAERRADGGRRPSRVVTGVLAAVLAFVTVWAVITLRAPQPDAVASRAALERQVEERTASVQKLQDSNARLRQEVADAQSAQLQRQGGEPLVNRSERLGVASGELPVTGPGLAVTLDDAPGVDEQAVGVDPRENSDAQKGRVLDRDVQIVVNGLWAAGAEAVSINGQRLTSLSAIRSAGEAILVDYRPLAPPYVVRAVGSPGALQSGFAADMAGPYVQSLRDNYGIKSSIAEQRQLSLPGAGEVALRWATVPTATASASSSGASGLATSSRPTEVSP